MPFNEDDTDVELYIVGEPPTFMIEVFVPGDQKYSLSADRLTISPIRRQLDKKHGIYRISDVTVTLKNEDGRYSKEDASSIFYGEQVLKDWVRIKSGWGPRWTNDVEVQFQGRIKELDTSSGWQARMVLLDGLKDFYDAAVNQDNATHVNDDDDPVLYVSSAEVPSMNPIDILEYLVDTIFDLNWFDMDSLVETDSILDSASLAAAREITSGIKIGATTWPMGSKLLDMAAGLMKMVAGYIYSGKDGKINTYIPAPSQDADSARGLYSFVGDETTKEPEILISRRAENLDNVINQVTWKYGQSNTEYACEVDTVSEGLYGLKTLELTTGWELHNGDTYILDIVAFRMMSRFALPIAEYDMSVSWLRNGDGLAMDLTNIVDITDPAHSIANEYVEVHREQVDLDNQVTQAVVYDASALRGKFWFFSSEVDERDGFGITAGNFATNWLRRFLFFSNPDTANKPAFDQEGNSNGTVEPTIPPIDDWGNGVEEHFIWS